MSTDSEAGCKPACLIAPLPVNTSCTGGRHVHGERKAKLGDGDLPLGVAVLYQMFGERPASHPFGTISVETVQAIGGGNINAGRKVLTRFISMVRSQRTRTRAA